MRIALIGHGKMGKELEKAAIAKGHEIVLIVDENNPEALDSIGDTKADVAIDFTTPGVVLQNISKCFKGNIPVLVGTTGWYDKLNEVKQKCISGGYTMMYASNFSIGVNILFEMNKQLAKLMNHQNGYQVSIEEIHHTQKLDSPSGTGITIAEGIIDKLDGKKRWKETEDITVIDESEIPIHSKRIGNTIGTHIIRYDSEVDILELKHEAKSRAGFVQGALAAAEWLRGKKGFYTMKDFLGLSS